MLQAVKWKVVYSFCVSIISGSAATSCGEICKQVMSPMTLAVGAGKQPDQAEGFPGVMKDNKHA